MTILSYFVVLIAVPLLGSIVAFIVSVPLIFLKKIIGLSPSLFLSGGIEGLVSIWIGIKILGFFNEDPGIVLIIITLITFIYKYIKSKPVGIPKETREEMAEIIRDAASDMDTPILIGNIVGLIVGCILFIY